MVSGCFDLLHSGHIVFFETASKYGQLYVCLGSDKTIQSLKNKPTMYSESERLFMVQSIKHVFDARISNGSGYLDFEQDLIDIKPDIFIVNEDGDRSEKKKLCEKIGVKYMVLPRIPKKNLPVRSSTSLKSSQSLPYRVCLAGGWMDQEFINRIAPGSVITVQVERPEGFMDRGGMATSTRKAWSTLTNNNIYVRDKEELAKVLFGYENPPGSRYVSGSQDAIGLTYPGINKLYYDQNYWPKKIDSCIDDEICRWLENHLVMIPLFERPSNYDPLLRQNINKKSVMKLGEAGELCFNSIINQDIIRLGQSLTDTHNAWRELLPLTTNEEIDQKIKSFSNCGYGAVTSGCGGGYIILATDQDVKDGFRISILR